MYIPIRVKEKRKAALKIDPPMTEPGACIGYGSVKIRFVFAQEMTDCCASFH
jgi:hypothetical protein